MQQESCQKGKTGLGGGVGGWGGIVPLLTAGQATVTLFLYLRHAFGLG